MHKVIKNTDYRQQDRQRAFTLIETMVVVAIIAIALSLATPSFTSFIQNTRIDTESLRLLEMIKKTRNNAITTSNRSFLCRSTRTQNNNNGNGISCRTAGTTNFDWNLELLSYTLLEGDPVTVPNNRFNNQKIQQVGSSGNNATKIQMLQSVRDASNNSVNVISNNNDNVLAFSAQGELLNAAPIRIAVCDDRGEDFGSIITINAAGLVRQTSTSASGTDTDCTPA